VTKLTRPLKLLVIIALGTLVPGCAVEPEELVSRSDASKQIVLDFQNGGQPVEACYFAISISEFDNQSYIEGGENKLSLREFATDTVSTSFEVARCSKTLFLNRQRNSIVFRDVIIEIDESACVLVVVDLVGKRNLSSEPICAGSDSD
jgi:hypothetical protein